MARGSVRAVLLWSVAECGTLEEDGGTLGSWGVVHGT